MKLELTLTLDGTATDDEALKWKFFDFLYKAEVRLVDSMDSEPDDAGFVKDLTVSVDGKEWVLDAHTEE